MTPCEEAAFAAGIETARQTALTTAVTIEARDGASRDQDQSTVAVLRQFADAARLLILGAEYGDGYGYLTE